MKEKYGVPVRFYWIFRVYLFRMHPLLLSEEVIQEILPLGLESSILTSPLVPLLAGQPCEFITDIFRSYLNIPSAPVQATLDFFQYLDVVDASLGNQLKIP